jgi:hypothetical protein
VLNFSEKLVFSELILGSLSGGMLDPTRAQLMDFVHEFAKEGFVEGTFNGVEMGLFDVVSPAAFQFLQKLLGDWLFSS